MKTFWWAGDRRDFSNFGDAITPLILQTVVGVKAEWAPAAKADLVVTGSVLTMLPRDWGGIIAGAGFAHPIKDWLERADIRAVRGRFTMSSLPYMMIETAPYLGDPGLLAPFLIEPQQKKYPLGIVPHYTDYSLRGVKGHYIDVKQDPLEVIREIARCEKIIASSLHGIIVADAFGIERKWHRFDRVQGGGFKFADYGTTVGMFAPGDWGRADPARVKKMQDDLVYVLEGV